MYQYRRGDAIGYHLCGCCDSSLPANFRTGGLAVSANKQVDLVSGCARAKWELHFWSLVGVLHVAGPWDSVLNPSTNNNADLDFSFRWPEGGAPPPSLDRCYNQILSPIHDACGASTFNAGSVNLQVFPAFVNGTVSTGLPVDGDYPSYIMVPQQSYCGINVGMDECS